MKAKFEKISHDNFPTLKVQDLQLPRFNAPWHYHPEYELTLILESHGTRYVGNSIEVFEKGDLVLIGSNMPHFWENASGYPVLKPEPRAIVVHFSKDFAGGNFFENPHMKKIKDLLVMSAGGLAFEKSTVENISLLLLNTTKLEGSDKVLGILEILNLLSKSPQKRLLNENDFFLKSNVKAANRINNVYRYVFENYHKKIILEEVASISKMTVNAFSRYFSQASGIPFNKFLNKVRINHACRLLQDGELSISQISFECGFNSISNFNKRFMDFKKITPSNFRKKYK